MKMLRNICCPLAALAAATALSGCSRESQSALPPAPVSDSGARESAASSASDTGAIGVASVRGEATPDKITTCNGYSPCIGGTNSGSGPGVEGVNRGSGNGLYALADNNDGVNGTTVNPSKSQRGRSGVYGADNSSDGGSGNAGVSGSSTSGLGVIGTTTSFNGVFGQSTSNFGVVAQSGSNVSLAASVSTGDFSPAIWAIGGTTNDSNGYSIATFQSDGTPAFWVDNGYNTHVNGLIYTTGPCQYGCARGRGGQVASYVAQSSTPILEDNGESRLQSGQARIGIDASLAPAIDEGASYEVFVSPEGPSNGLYVTAKTATGFRVVESEGGRSTIAFSYRIIAKPYGTHAARLPIVTPAQMPHVVPINTPRELPRKPGA
jgi:hypothetical protein